MCHAGGSFAAVALDGGVARTVACTTGGRAQPAKTTVNAVAAQSNRLTPGLYPISARCGAARHCGRQATRASDFSIARLTSIDVGASLQAGCVAGAHEPGSVGVGRDQPGGAPDRTGGWLGQSPERLREGSASSTTKAASPTKYAARAPLLTATDPWKVRPQSGYIRLIMRWSFYCAVR
jgi:hypothetical protein